MINHNKKTLHKAFFNIFFLKFNFLTKKIQSILLKNSQEFSS